MSVLKGIDLIRKWVIQTRLKEQTKQGGVMITLPKKEFVDLNTSITAERLMRNGFDPNAFTNTNQVENAINQINKRSVISQDDPRFKGIMESLMGKKDNVVDMEGNKIPEGSKIMGGKEVKPIDELENYTKSKEDIVQDLVDRKFGKNYFDDLAPPGSRGGADDIAAPVQSAEETLKNMIMAENKKNIAAMKNRKMIKDAVDNVSPGFVKGDRKYNAQLVAEDLADKKFGKDFYDLDQKQQMDLYDEALDGLSVDLEDFAKGGIARIGLKDGMNRRTFMKIFSGLVALPIIGKIVKPLKVGKTVTKVPIIKTDNVAGKPEWFDQLVNKVILEGDDVTKRFATKDREIVHMKKLDDDTNVMVTQDLDEGAVRVEYQSPENVYGEDVLLQYKKPLPDEGAPRPSAEFATAESGPVSRVIGPDDVELDVDEVGGMSIKDLDSDVSKLKEYATGQKPTMKELVQNIKRKDKAARITDDIDGAASDAVIRRQGDFDPSDYDDFASGGIARMLGE